MDIPSIKFRYFEKLKLWHDYLSKGSVYEKEKCEYWKYEKMILHWAYSSKHRHLFTAIDNKRILEAFGINKDNPKEERKTSEFKDINTELDIESLIVDLQKDAGKVNYFMGNLVIEGFFESVGGVSESYPERIRVNNRGLLIGEVLNEAYNKPSFLNKDFIKYKVGIIILWSIVIMVFLSLVATFLNQGFELKAKIYDDRDKINIRSNYKVYHHEFHR